MTDYIKKAVELADGWEHDGNEIFNPVWYETPFGEVHADDLRACHFDALAAQLVRQVDALPGPTHCNIYWRRTEIWKRNMAPVNGRHSDGDRTMNTIKAIVESGVLE